MNSSYFYTNVSKNGRAKSDIIDYFDEYAQKEHLQIYLINKPLGENKYTYKQDNIVVLLVPRSKITFINIEDNNEK